MYCKLLNTVCNSFFLSSRRLHTRWPRDWSSDVCSSDLSVPCQPWSAVRTRIHRLSCYEEDMQVSIETTSGLERRLTIGVPAAQVESEVQKRLQEAATSIRLNGFRKGKVPLTAVKQRSGAGGRHEVVGEVLNR